MMTRAIEEFPERTIWGALGRSGALWGDLGRFRVKRTKTRGASISFAHFQRKPCQPAMLERALSVQALPTHPPLVVSSCVM